TQRLLPHLQKLRPAHVLSGPAMQALQNFDGSMRADGAAPLIFSVWADEFTREVLGRKLGRARFEALYGKRLFRSGVELILETDNRFWCGDAGCETVATRALDRALERIRGEQ